MSKQSGLLAFFKPKTSSALAAAQKPSMLTIGASVLHKTTRQTGRIIKLARNEKGLVEAVCLADGGQEIRGSPTLGKDFEQADSARASGADRSRSAEERANAATIDAVSKPPEKEEGEKRISITVDVGDGQAVIVVEDNGIGIEERYREEVFNLFARATQKNVGTGLGLYMVKEAVEQMGGQVVLDSEPNEGTTMTVTLPNLNKETL